MKKHILIFTALLLIALPGCAKEPEKEPADDTEQMQTKSERVRHDLKKAEDNSGYNKVSDYLYDIDSDGEEDLIELLTTAHVENGEVHEDDGQSWRVSVTTSDGVYTLCDEYIQLGSAEVDIGEFYNDEPEKVLILTVTTGAGKSIRHYTYSDGAFYEELVYTTASFAADGANLTASIK